MQRISIIGWKATSPAGYDCSFMVMYPTEKLTKGELVNRANVCQNAIREAHRLHGKITIHTQVEREVIVR